MNRPSMSVASTDRKYKLQSTPTQYTLKPPSSTTPLCSPPPTINFRSKTTYVRCLRRFDTRNRRKLHTAYNPELAHHTIHRTTPAPDPHQSTLPPHVPFLQRRITTPMSGQTPVPGSAPVPPRIMQSLNMLRNRIEVSGEYWST